MNRCECCEHEIDADALVLICPLCFEHVRYASGRDYALYCSLHHVHLSHELKRHPAWDRFVKLA